MKKIFFLLLLLSVLIRSSYSQRENSKQNFENEVASFLGHKYYLNGIKHYKVSDKKELRSAFFYSSSLKHAVLYKFKKQLNFNDIFLNFTIYTYSNPDTAIKIVNHFQEDLKKRIAEHEYGRLGKDFQCFFEANNNVIHLEGACLSDNEKEWIDIQNSIVKIANKYYSPVLLIVAKPCE